MFIKHTGQPHKVIYVTDSYQRVTQNKDNYADHTGVASHFAVEAIADAIAKIASGPGVIVVDKTVPVAADLTIGANISIDIRDGGSFAVSSGKTLTISGPFAVNGQPFGTVFTGAGTVIAISKGVFSQIESGEGFVLGGSAQSIFEYSTTPNFPLGYRRVVDDRVFKYSKANDSNTVLSLFGARCTNFPQEGSTDAVIYAVGTYEITIPMNDNAVNEAAEKLEDYWKDGYIWVQEYPQVNGVGEIYRIKSSAAAVGSFVTLTLETPIRVQVGASSWITAWPNPYQNVDTTPDARMSVICVPLITVPAEKYFWGQTWGPIFMSSGSAPGRGDHERDLYFNPTKTLTPGQAGVLPATDIAWHTSGNPIPQRAGFIITNTNEWTPAGGGTELGGDQFMMLQLSP